MQGYTIVDCIQLNLPNRNHRDAFLVLEASFSTANLQQCAKKGDQERKHTVRSVVSIVLDRTRSCMHSQ